MSQLNLDTSEVHEEEMEDKRFPVGLFSGMFATVFLINCGLEYNSLRGPFELSGLIGRALAHTVFSLLLFLPIYFIVNAITKSSNTRVAAYVTAFIVLELLILRFG